MIVLELDFCVYENGYIVIGKRLVLDLKMIMIDLY